MPADEVGSTTLNVSPARVELALLDTDVSFHEPSPR